MKKTNFILIGLSLIFLSLLALATMSGSPAVSAAPPAVACYSLYLPAIMSSGGMNGATIQEVGAPRSPQVACGTARAAFPDFNADGYADLVIGVANKELVIEEEILSNAGVVHVIYGSANGLNAMAGQAAIDDQLWVRHIGGAMPEHGDFYGTALAMGDFDNDGYDDLAIGISGARINGQDSAGAVQIIYGSEAGLDANRVEEWSRGSEGINGTVTAFDMFGRELTAGDYNGDGYSDLAIGAPSADVNGVEDAGAIHILYGRAAGLRALGNELLTQDTNGFLASPAEVNDFFGQVLTTGDFNGDGVDDLAVGTPREDNGEAFVDAGSVQIFFGQGGTVGDWGIIRFGLVANPQHWTADSNAYVEGVMEPNEQFGYALSAGDFDGDGYDDLAVGIPFESHGSGASALLAGGAVSVFRGGATGLVATAASPARLWHQDSPDMVDVVAAHEWFGTSLIAADFNNDGYDDLAIGVNGNVLFGVNIGSVHVMYGSGGGLTAAGNELVYDPLHPDGGDNFGGNTTAGDYNGDGFAELVVGASYDQPPGVAADNSGSVLTFGSDGSGVLHLEAQKWYPGHNGLQGTPAEDDYFGSGLPGS